MNSTPHDAKEIEEFPLLLNSSEVSALIEAARRQGLCAASLARRVIHQYLLETQSSLAEPFESEPKPSRGRIKP